MKHIHARIEHEPQSTHVSEGLHKNNNIGIYWWCATWQNGCPKPQIDLWEHYSSQVMYGFVFQQKLFMLEFDSLAEY